MKNARGFSLLEVLIASMLLTIFLGTAYGLLENVRTTQQRNEVRAEAQQRVRLALIRIADAVRGAGADPTGRAFKKGHKPLLDEGKKKLRVKRDLPRDVNDNGHTYDVRDLNNDGDTEDDDENENGDGVLNDPQEDVTFEFRESDDILVMIDNVTGDEVVLAEGIVGNPSNEPVFEVTKDGNEILSVTVRLTAESDDADPLTDEVVSFTAETTIYPRMVRPRLLDSVAGS